MGYKQFGYFCLMSMLRRIFNFYLDASVHVAFAIFALVRISEITLNIFGNSHFAWFLFFGSIGCYNFIKYGLEAKKYLLVANHYHLGIQFFSLIALVFALYHAHFLTAQLWIGIGILAVLTALYALPVLPNARNLRSWGGLKIFIVALVWAVATVVLPIIANREILTWDVWIETVQRFVLVLILLVPFEIRDLKYDHEAMRTMPQRYGVTNTKIFGGFATLLFFVITFLKDDLTTQELILKGVLFLTLGITLFVTQRNQQKYFASFWVEAIPIFGFGLALVLEQ